MLRISLATLLLSSRAVAQSFPAALVTAFRYSVLYESKNTTVAVPFDTPFSAPIFGQVSSLYLSGASGGVPVDSITCHGYGDADATQPLGLPFNITSPAMLSTNFVVVGSVVCRTTDVAVESSGINSTAGGPAWNTSNPSSTRAMFPPSPTGGDGATSGDSGSDSANAAVGNRSAVRGGAYYRGLAVLWVVFASLL